MRKIILAVALIAATLSAKAWHINCDKGVLLAAAQNYNPETLKLMQRYVGEDLSKPAQYLQSVRKDGRLLESKDWHTLHLNADLKPAATDDKDAYVQIGSTTSKPGAANGEFTLNITNSIAEFTKEVGVKQAPTLVVFKDNNVEDPVEYE